MIPKRTTGDTEEARQSCGMPLMFGSGLVWFHQMFESWLTVVGSKPNINLVGAVNAADTTSERPGVGNWQELDFQANGAEIQAGV